MNSHLWASLSLLAFITEIVDSCNFKDRNILRNTRAESDYKKISVHNEFQCFKMCSYITNCFGYNYRLSPSFCQPVSRGAEMNVDVSVNFVEMPKDDQGSPEESCLSERSCRAGFMSMRTNGGKDYMCIPDTSMKKTDFHLEVTTRNEERQDKDENLKVTTTVDDRHEDTTTSPVENLEEVTTTVDDRHEDTKTSPMENHNDFTQTTVGYYDANKTDKPLYRKRNVTNCTTVCNNLFSGERGVITIINLNIISLTNKCIDSEVTVSYPEVESFEFCKRFTLPPVYIHENQRIYIEVSPGLGEILQVNLDIAKYKTPDCHVTLEGEGTIDFAYTQGSTVVKNRSCEWDLNAADNELVVVRFLNFNLSNGGCYKDYIGFRDSSRKYYRYCGERERVFFRSPITLVIHIHTDVNQSFTARVSPVSPLDCSARYPLLESERYYYATNTYTGLSNKTCSANYSIQSLGQEAPVIIMEVYDVYLIGLNNGIMITDKDGIYLSSWHYIPVFHNVSLPLVYMSISDLVTLSFIITNEEDKFKFIFKFNRGTIQNCNQNVISDGVINVPGKFSNTIDQLVCFWNITVKPTKRLLILSITEYDTNISTTSSTDYLEITDYKGETNRTSGENFFSLFESYVQVKAHIDYRIRVKGFKLKYSST